MIDISTTAPIVFRRLHFLLPNLPRPAIGASLTAIAILLGDALNMGYVDPYASRRQTRLVRDDDLEGRDPSW